MEYVYTLLFVLAWGLLCLIRENMWIKETGGTSNKKKLNLQKFYIECVLSNYVDFNNEKYIEKIKLLASKYELHNGTSIEDLILSARDAYLSNERIVARSKRKREQYNEIKKELTEISELLSKYSDDYGRDKRINMLNDRISDLSKKSKNLMNTTTALLDSMITKEHDWAVHGGIASGIAGPAAGVATAIKYQQKNEEIRAQNVQNMKTATSFVSDVSKQQQKYSNEQEYLKKKLDETYEKMVAPDTKENVFELISFSDVEFVYYETGGFRVSVNVEAKDKVTVHGESAVIDGSFICRLLKDGKVISEVILVLPLEGLDDKMEITGVSATGDTSVDLQSCEYRFYPKKLWIIEK